MATTGADGKKIHLKYLFRAYFANGDVITQDQDDTSHVDPTKSRFTDVLDMVRNGVPLVYFELFSEGEDDDTYGVDLINGEFDVRGKVFKVHEADLENFRVLFFRVRDTHFTPEMQVIGEEVAYRIGWQANEKRTKRNEEHWIEIS